MNNSTDEGASGPPRGVWLAAGVIALASAVVAMGADLASGWSLRAEAAMGGALSLRIEDVRPLLVVKSPESLVLGHYLAILSIPVGVAGVWHVSVGLRGAGALWSRAFMATGAFTYALGTAYHASYGFVATVLQAGDAALVERVAPFFEPFGTLVIAAMIVTMAPLIGAILTGRTLYPRWMALLTPLPVQLAISAAAAPLSPVAANFLTVIGLNGSMAVLFAMSLWVAARSE